MKSRIILSIVAVAIFSAVELRGEKEWSYHERDPFGPTHWADQNNSCGDDTKQSPININSSRLDSGLEKFVFHGYDELAHSIIARHDGHTVRIVTNDSLSISGGSLNGNFTFRDLHFHWGENDTVGSEHGIEGKTYPLEMHFVHWNKDKYLSFDRAVLMQDGLAVLGVLAVVVDDNDTRVNKALGNLTSSFISIHFFNNFTEVPPFKFIDLFPKNLQYYRYQGSLTTPPCYESVTWTVFKDPIYITHDQAHEFRLFHEKNFTQQDIDHTYRPFQPLGNRTVLLSDSFPSTTAVVQKSSAVGLHFYCTLATLVELVLVTLCILMMQV